MVVKYRDGSREDSVIMDGTLAEEKHCCRYEFVVAFREVKTPRGTACAAQLCGK